MSYEIVWESNGVIVKFSGTFGHQENSEANMELFSSPRFESLKFMIWDLTEVSELDMSEDEAAIAADYDKLASARLPHVKLAFLVQDRKTKKLCENYIAYTKNRNLEWEFTISDNMKSIRKWINS